MGANDVKRFLYTALGGLVVLSSGLLPAGGQCQEACPKATPDGVPVKVHEVQSKVFSAPFPTGNLALRAKEHGDVVLVGGTPMPFFEPSADKSLPDVVKRLTCTSNAVVSGSVLSSFSFLTSDQQWVFTDSLLQVDEVLKNNRASLIEPNAHIVVARRGGTVRLSDGHKVRVTEDAFPSLQVGRKYLLFLQYVPESGGYATVLLDSSFSLADGVVTRLGPEALPEEKNKALDAAVFSSLVRQAAQECETSAGVMQ